jgi:hypothetical protein
VKIRQMALTSRLYCLSWALSTGLNGLILSCSRIQLVARPSKECIVRLCAMRFWGIVEQKPPANTFLVSVKPFLRT